MNYKTWISRHIKRLGHVQAQNLRTQQHNRFQCYLVSADSSGQIDHPVSEGVFDDFSDN